ncbi:DUF262 domain-containing protein [Halorubrum sp. BV1]|uniref:DUF262 domain-containing protein n=1 Tax=Halorubrum sp. BV1 TaxID=1498500 RepID=UPI000678D456|nr:DUF262 domain-containing protein [Halorubrum sp. BV1]
MLNTLSDYVSRVNGRVMLPGLQREFIWTENQITALFDSFMRDYPVGQVTLWEVRDTNEYTTYQFIEQHLSGTGRFPDDLRDQGFERTNTRIEENNGCDYLVIDGQQRVNSAYLGLCGSIAAYTGGRGGEKDRLRHWEERELCLNLFGSPSYPEAEGLNLAGNYEFEFRPTGELNGTQADNYTITNGTHRLWIPLSEFLDEDRVPLKDAEASAKVNNLLKETAIDATADQRNMLQQIVTHVSTDFQRSVLEYELPNTQDTYASDDVHEIFKRINLNGSRPKPYQYVQSLLMSHAPYVDDGDFLPRERTADFVERLTGRYPGFEDAIDIEFITRCLVYLINEDLLQNTVESFEKDDEIEELRELWYAKGDLGNPHGRFEKAVDNAFETVETLGFSASTLPSMLTVALFAKFYYENKDAEVSEPNQRAIFEFLAKVTLLQSLTGSQARGMSVELSRIHNSEGDLEVFPTDELLDRMGEVMTIEHIEKAILDSHNTSTSSAGVFRSKQVAAILGLLEESYTEQSVGRLELDHIYPKSKQDSYEAAVDDSVDVHRIGNLQLLEKDVNNSKGDKLPLEWFDELTEAEIEKYRRINCFPDTEPNKENYTDFVEAREEQIRDYLVDKYVKRPTDPAVQ